MYNTYSTYKLLGKLLKCWKHLRISLHIGWNWQNSLTFTQWLCHCRKTCNIYFTHCALWQLYGQKFNKGTKKKTGLKKTLQEETFCSVTKKGQTLLWKAHCKSLTSGDFYFLPDRILALRICGATVCFNFSY